jgi:hypothetical protein
MVYEFDKIENEIIRITNIDDIEYKKFNNFES